MVVAAPAGFEDEFRRLAPGATVVPGGSSRSESVKAALERVETDLVLVHDAARPLASPDLFDAVAAEMSKDGSADAVIAATRLADTVKRVGEDARVLETVPRDALWSVQTPQGFRAEALRNALDADPQALADATDDASLVEAAGGAVRVLAADGPNPKLTTPADLAVIEALLRASG